MEYLHLMNVSLILANFIALILVFCLLDLKYFRDLFQQNGGGTGNRRCSCGKRKITLNNLWNHQTYKDQMEDSDHAHRCTFIVILKNKGLKRTSEREINAQDDTHEDVTKLLSTDDRDGVDRKAPWSALVTKLAGKGQPVGEQGQRSNGDVYLELEDLTATTKKY